MGALKIAITGAGGFLGHTCVQAAKARGHEVIALTRADADLSEPLPLGLFAGAQAVIHTAAAMSNDPEALARDTEHSTRNLIEAALAIEPKPLIVLASSIAVYDADLRGSVSEDCQTERHPGSREPYIAAKLAQEEALRAADLQSWCLRIGAIYGPERMWNAHLGLRRGPLLLRLGAAGDVPLVHVSDAAEALVRAAETSPQENGEVLNIIEDHLPDRKTCSKALHKGMTLPLNWRVLMPLATVAGTLFGARLPGLLRPRILKARFAPLSYPNTAAKARLGWHPAMKFRKVST